MRSENNQIDRESLGGVGNFRPGTADPDKSLATLAVAHAFSVDFQQTVTAGPQVKLELLFQLRRNGELVEAKTGGFEDMQQDDGGFKSVSQHHCVINRAQGAVRKIDRNQDSPQARLQGAHAFGWRWLSA